MKKHIKVKELLEKLKDANPELPVKLCDDDGNVSQISEVSVETNVEVLLNYNFEPIEDDEDEDE